jgi:sulfopyruvate decarboxylase TPP-binding subunit
MTGVPAGSSPVASIHRGLRAGGVDLVVYLPDSVLDGVMASLEADPAITTVVCTREDEGVAIAAGAALAGRTPAVLMEGSGLGLSGLILARSILHHVPLLVLASHSRGLGERRAFHAAGILAGEGTLIGLGIPYRVVTDPASLEVSVEQAVVTCLGQRCVVGLLIPPFVMEEGGHASR